ncbi:MAG: 50S ribosomal protein L4 [Gemmatimonadales bacterium]
MPEAQFFTSAAQAKGNVKLPTEFNGVVHKGALYQAVRAYRGNQRQGTHSTKTRAEVSGGGRKPWRQKGTGRARQGTIRAAQFRGGGVVFGPKPRSYRIELPKKLRRLARQSALNQRASEGALVVIENFDFEAPKTRQLRETLEKIGFGGRKVLVLTKGPKPNVYLSGRNMARVSVLPYADASAYEILWADKVVIEQDALAANADGGKAVNNG